MIAEKSIVPQRATQEMLTAPVFYAPSTWSKEEFKGYIEKYEKELEKLPAAKKMTEKPEGCEYGKLNHVYCDGSYVRQITMPKGVILTSKIHKIQHPYFIMQGECSVISEEGTVRLRAPYWGVTEPGTKRLLYIHETTIWVTVHVTNKKDLSEIEKEVIAKDFEEFESLKMIEQHLKTQEAK